MRKLNSEHDTPNPEKVAKEIGAHEPINCRHFVAQTTKQIRILINGYVIRLNKFRT